MIVGVAAAAAAVVGLVAFTERGRKAVSVLIWGDPVEEEAAYLREVLVRCRAVLVDVLARS